MDNHSLPIFLQTSVSLRLLDYRARGGPTPEDWERARAFGGILAQSGDRLLFRSTQPGETASLANQLADALAVLTFVPGGVTLFGSHFESPLGLSHHEIVSGETS